MPGKSIRIQRSCLYCGKEIYTFPCRIRDGESKYCSQKCANIGKVVPAEQRFWSKVNKTETCWLWTSCTYSGGYGKFDAIASHRMSWIMAYGPIPDGLCVCHKCDVRRCVRPDHLFLGTKADNTADMIAKGRGCKGENLAKLVEEDVKTIRAKFANGIATQASLAKEFGVLQSNISQIVNRKTWKHVV